MSAVSTTTSLMESGASTSTASLYAPTHLFRCSPNPNFNPNHTPIQGGPLQICIGTSRRSTTTLETWSASIGLLEQVLSTHRDQKVAAAFAVVPFQGGFPRMLLLHSDCAFFMNTDYKSCYEYQ